MVVDERFVGPLEVTAEQTKGLDELTTLFIRASEACLVEASPLEGRLSEESLENSESSEGSEEGAIELESLASEEDPLSFSADADGGGSGDQSNKEHSSE